MKKAVCTVCTKNYLPYARTLMKGVAPFHPDWEQIVLLADRPEGYFDPKAEPFAVILIDDLPIPDRLRFYFRHHTYGLCASAKAWLVEHLFEDGFEQVVYLDSDTCVYAPMTSAERMLEDGARMVLTPHLTRPYPKGSINVERDAVRSGAANTGFFAMRRDPQTMDFLMWLKEKCLLECVIDFPNGLFMEQKWFDLAPGMIEGVEFLRDDAYNVAFWNLETRRVSRQNGRFYAGDRPLVHYHFSNFNPRQPQRLVTYLPMKAEDFGVVELLAEYARSLFDNGLETCSKWPPAFGRFSDGKQIPDCLRSYYRSHVEFQVQMGDNPFDFPSGYFNQSWPIGAAADSLVTVLTRQLWETRVDLQYGFPEYLPGSRVNYARWWVDYGAPEIKAADYYIQPVRDALAALPPARLRSSGIPLPRRLAKWIVPRRIRDHVRTYMYNLLFPPSNTKKEQS